MDINTTGTELVPYLMKNDYNINTIGPLFQGLARILDEKRIVYHRTHAFIAILTLVSAHLNENIVSIITEETGANGLAFLNEISGLIPGSMKREVSEITKQIFYHNSNSLKNRTVIAFTPKVIERNREIIMRLIQSGQVNDRILGRAGGTTNIDEVKIEGPTSLIMLAGQKAPKWLNDYEVLRLTLDNNPNYVAEQLERRRVKPSNGSQSFENCISKEIERLIPKPVDIDFLPQIIDCLDKTNPESLFMFDSIQKLLNVITIMNHAVFATPQEIAAGYYNIDMVRSGNPNKLLPGSQSGTSDSIESSQLVATKVEYNILYGLIPILFNFGDNAAEGNDAVVFHAIKEMNLKFVLNSTTINPQKYTEREVIETMDAQQDNRGWVSVLRIKEHLAKHVAKKFSDSTINRSLQSLVERDIITKKKDTKSPNKFTYAVNTLSLEKEITLPKPSEIIDPVYEGQPVEVIDLLTGEKLII